MPTPSNGAIPRAPQFSIEFKDDSIGLEGYVCIHAIGRNGSSGGMRCVPGVSKEEVYLLARAMTYKYAFFDVPQGGAKAGLRVPYEAGREEKLELIRAAARHLKPIIRRSDFWSVWTDMNFYGPELQAFFKEVGIDYRPNPRLNSSMRTAVSAFWSIQATLDHYGLRPREATLALEGFGSVASYLAPLLASIGVKVTAVSNHLKAIANDKGLDVVHLAELRAAYGNEWIDQPGDWEEIAHDDLFARPVDILVPCARVHSVGRDRARAIQARCVVPIANVPCTDAALDTLDERGINFVPDYVVNGGGVLGHINGPGHEFGGPFRSMFQRMMLASKLTDTPVRRLAEQAADRNFPRVAGEAYRKEPFLEDMANRLRHRGLLPRGLAERMRKERDARIYARVNSLFTA